MVDSEIRRDGTQLIVYIPSELAEPEIKMRQETQTVFEPGHFIEIPTTLSLGTLEERGRRPIILQKSYLQALSPNLDVTKEVSVRPGSIGRGYGLPIRAHPQDETGERLRVWIPRVEVERLGLRNLYITEIPVRIYGTTLPGERQEKRWVEYEALRVYHLGRHYDAEQTAGRWVWLVPEKLGYKPPADRAEITLEPEKIFRAAYNMGYSAWADVFKAGRGEVTIELGIFNRYGPDVAKQVSRINGFAFRNVANRNYSLKDEGAYPFFCELRASFITVYPREFIELYDPRLTNGYYLATLIGKGPHGILGITLRNIVRWIFVKRLTTEEGQQRIARYLFSGKLKRDDYQRRFVISSDAKRNVNRWKLEPGRSIQGQEPPTDIVTSGTWQNEEILLTEGLEINEMIDELKFSRFAFEKSIKYARIINKQMHYYVYNNDWIEAQVRSTPEVYMDNKYSFVWTHQQYLERSEV